jgi:hypothetical protein
VFPWRGVLRAPVQIGETVLPIGDRVRVDGKHDGRFAVTALPLIRDLTGTAPASAVDEPLCAAIERHLLGRQSLRWGQDQRSWRGLGRANQDFTLGEGSERVAVTTGDIVSVSEGRSTGTCGVSKDGQADLVPAGHVTLILDRPDPTGALQLMCYEMPPYAASLADLYPDFMRTANQATCFGLGDAESVLAYWARAIGALLSGPQITPAQFATTGLQRGDLVQFWSDQHGYMHTAVATGDGQDIYSLWNTPADYVVRVSLSALCAGAAETETRYVRTAMPAWHRF